MIRIARIFIENINDYILIDDEDEVWVNQYKWHISYAHSTMRCLAWVLGRKVSLSMYITKKENAYQKIKGLDFRKSNIGVDEHKHRYRKPQKNASSKYKGVSKSKNDNRFRASINLGDERVFLGRFDKEEAAIAYNQAVEKYWNGHGYINPIPIKDE